MKKAGLLFFTFLITVFQFSMAQDCSQGFYALKEGTKVSMSNYNEKGKVTSTSESIVKSVKADGSKFEATIEASAKDAKNRPILEGKNFTVTCDNGTVKLDISSMMMVDFASQMKSMDVTITGTGIEIPSNLSEGMTLADGNTEMKLGSNGMTFMTMKFDIKNRKVEKKESITTPAGTFDCYKITYDLDMKTIVKRQIKAVQWLAPNVGLVKSETYSQKGELEGYSELTKISH